MSRVINLLWVSLTHNVPFFTSSPVTEHKDDDRVTLNCSVWTRGRCLHKVKWFFRTNDVGTDHKDLKTTQSNCSSKVTFTTSHFIYESKNYNLLKCNVTDGYNRKVQQFTFKSEPSGENMMSCLNHLKL